MASKTNIKEVGWMYHASRKQTLNNHEYQSSVISQIPLLNPAEIEDPTLANKQASYIKPTDSDYIALCKMGGRKNLLSMKDSEKKSNDMVSYPRCEWFYLLDNELEDSQNKPNQNVYKSQVPDYMVYDVIEKKQKPVQNIQINIEENPQSLKKPKSKQIKKSQTNATKVIVPKSMGVTRQEIDSKKSNLAKKTVVKKEEPVDMFTLLSYGYNKQTVK